MHNPEYDVALLVHSCDRYEFLYKGFDFFFSRYWDRSVKCNCYFATEEKDTSFPEFKNIKSGKGEWADRLAFLLNEKIPEKYIIYFQEDMWLNKKVNANFFNRLFDITKQQDWQQVKLHSSAIYKTTGTGIFIEGFGISKIDNDRSDFLMSHQVTLWNKASFLEQLHKKEHPWRNERKATKRLRKLNADIFHADYFAENGNSEINTNNHPVLRSGYYTISVNAILNNNIQRYIPGLLKADPADKKYAADLESHYENQLTHDGKQKPRKDDIFKKIKNWIKGK